VFFGANVGKYTTHGAYGKPWNHVKNSQKSYPKNNPRMKTIIKQSCRKRKKMHQEVPRHHNFTIFTSLCLSTPSTGPPLRRTGSEQRLLSRWLQAAPGTCRFSDFGRSSISMEIYGKNQDFGELHLL
jgi:hypothetical protein